MLKQIKVKKHVNERKVCMCAPSASTTLCEIFSHHFENTLTPHSSREEFLQLRKSLESLVRLANFSTFDEVRRIFYNQCIKIINCIDPPSSGTHRMLISCHNKHHCGGCLKRPRRGAII